MSSLSIVSVIAVDVLFRKGVPPVTVAEWTLQGDGNVDFYDGTRLYHNLNYSIYLILSRIVSLVDGYDLPMRIDNSVGCSVADCPVDLGPTCQFFSY